jgi:hypothetical protein
MVKREGVLSPNCAKERSQETMTLTLATDRDRIVVVGESAGRHLAAALGTVERFDDPSDDGRWKIVRAGIAPVAGLCETCHQIADPLGK